MSTPENRLNQFRSYSYHHILVAANSTNVLEDMRNPKSEVKLSKLLSAPIKNRTTPKVEHLSSEKGDYVVITNGAQDSDFYISDFKWESVLNPSFGSSGKPSASTLIGLEGLMTIVEPQNIRFMHYLKRVFDALQSDPISTVFIIKTVFVGYPDTTNNKEADTNPVVISDVKPLGVTMYDLASTFEATGGIYKLSFVGISNGTAQLPQHQNAMSQISAISTSLKVSEPNMANTTTRTKAKPEHVYKDAPLADIIKRLEEEINVKYNEFFKKHPNSKNRQQVIYQIDVDEVPYGKPYLVSQIGTNDRYSVDSVNERFRTLAKEENPKLQNHIGFPPNCTVTQAIDIIMQSSSRVLSDAKKDPKQKGKLKSKLYTYKIVTTIKIDRKPIKNVNSGTYTIIFKIKRFEMPETNKETALKTGTSTSDLAEAAGRVIEYDYLFTGKNVDIIDMKLEMDLALQFLMMYNTVGNVPDKSGTANIDNAVVAGSNENATYEVRQNTPLFPPQKITTAQIIHSPDQARTLNFRALLNKFSLISAIESKVTVTGNPMFLNEQIQTPKEIEESIESDESKDKTGLGNMSKTPALMKIHIRMPVDDYTDSGGPIRTEPFWYQGFYHIIAITNNFSNGSFTQDFEIVALPEEGEDIFTPTEKVTDYVTKRSTPESTDDTDLKKLNAVDIVVQSSLPEWAIDGK